MDKTTTPPQNDNEGLSLDVFRALYENKVILDVDIERFAWRTGTNWAICLVPTWEEYLIIANQLEEQGEVNEWQTDTHICLEMTLDGWWLNFAVLL